MESKYLKAYCAKTNRKLALEIQQFGNTWRVVNAVALTEDEAKFLTSHVEQPSFETNANLLPCLKCGSRKIGGCSCSKSAHPCSASMKYQFDCVYCKELKLDYSLPERPADGNIPKTIKLSQGGETEIKYADNRPLTEISVGVGWDPAIIGSRMDVDASVVLLSSDCQSKDLVYFGDLIHSSGCVIHHGDNLTGDGDVQDGDDENITVYLNKVPANRDKLVFVLNIYECEERNQTLDTIKNLYIKLYDPVSKNALIEYRATGNYGRDTAIIIAVASKKGNVWKFKAIDKSLKVDNVNRIAEECKRYFS